VLLVKFQSRTVPVLTNALTAQHANAVIGVVQAIFVDVKYSPGELLRNCEASIRHLEWLTDQLDDAFMVATCLSLIEAFQEAVRVHSLSGLRRHYKLPVRYFIQRFGARELLQDLLSKNAEVLI